MLISTGTLTHTSLRGQVAIVTGAGRGIGFEACRSLIWLGARVILAEIDRETGDEASAKLRDKLAFRNGPAACVVRRSDPWSHRSDDEGREKRGALAPERAAEALALCRSVRRTLDEQARGWKDRSLFERQWMVRDFKRNAGMTVEDWLGALASLEGTLAADGGASPTETDPPLVRLVGYYDHMLDLARGYEKDPARLAEQVRIVQGWRDEVESLRQLVVGGI